MPNLKSVMDELRRKGKENTRVIYSRHGIPIEKTFGVSTADLKAIAKTLKGQQALALELYATGIMDAMYLAGMVAHGAQMSKQQLQAWAEGSGGMPMIAEYTVPWVTVESPHAWELAKRWVKSKEEHLASSGWSTYAGLVGILPDSALDLAEIEKLLKAVVKQIKSAPNRVRYTMNGFVIATGICAKPLLRDAKAAARQIGEVYVDVGETACKVPLASASIAKNEAAGKVGKKRKTIRC
jgi:3-methyladenine DNA glycosylase AlkD